MAAIVTGCSLAASGGRAGLRLGSYWPASYDVVLAAAAASRVLKSDMAQQKLRRLHLHDRKAPCQDQPFFADLTESVGGRT